MDDRGPATAWAARDRLPYPASVRRVSPIVAAWVLVGCSLALELNDPEPDPGPGSDVGQADGGPPRDAAVAPRRVDAAPPLDAAQPPPPDVSLPVPVSSDAGRPPPVDAEPDVGAAPCDDGRFVGSRCDRCVVEGLDGPACDRCVDARRAPPTCAACANGFGGPGCAPVADTAAVGDDGPWDPAARITWADIPADAETARRAGCRLWGDAGGSALSALTALSGPLPPRVQPDENGEIGLILLAGFEGWGPGETANAASPVTLSFYVGGPGDHGGFVVRANSFEGGDPARRARNRFPDAATAGRRLLAGPAPFQLTLDLRDELPFALLIEGARVVGDLDVRAGPGVAVGGGRLEGYLTRAGLVRTVEQIQATCRGSAPPATCATITPFIDPDGPAEVGADLLAALVGGYEARYEVAGPRRCLPREPGDCNAVGFCMLFEAEGVTIEGVAP